MENYFKYTGENNTECFLELDKEFYCERAIYKTKNNVINTYLTVEHKSYFLPEGSLKDGLEYMNSSSKAEFESLWKESMMEFESEWEELKMNYKIGEKVKTRILCFYPKGVISNFGEKFNAIANFQACKDKFGKEKMYPNNEIDLIISGFDEINKIVLLKTDE